MNRQPTSVSFTISNNCNLRCKFCYANEYIKNYDVNIFQLKKIIMKLKEIGVFTVTLTGGEPFIRKDIFKIIGILKDNDFEVNINTNGILITSEVAKKLLKLNVNYVRVSLDSPNPEIHDKIRGKKGAYSAALKGITTLLDNGVKTNVAMVIMKSNCQDLYELYKLLVGLNIDTWHLFRLINNGDNDYYRMESITPVNYKNIIYKVMEMENEKKINISFNDPLYSFYSNKNTYGCGACKSYFSVDSFGKFRWCPSLTDCKGNILKDDFNEIWNNNLSTSIRYKNIIKKCSLCKYKELCGGCPSSSYGIYGDDFFRDPMCMED